MIITIKTCNAAFDDGNRAAEVVAILRQLADNIAEADSLDVVLPHDANGNCVGGIRTNREDRKP